MTANELANEYVGWIACASCGQKVTGDSKHTCLPKLRELTDEEIMEIYNDQANRDFQLRSDPFKFARAILQKASEK